MVGCICFGKALNGTYPALSYDVIRTRKSSKCLALKIVACVSLAMINCFEIFRGLIL